MLLSRVVAVTALLSGALASLSSAHASPATDLFDQVSRLLQTRYGGLSSADRAALVEKYRPELDKACADQPDTCPTDQAYPLLKKAVGDLGDRHSYLYPPAEEKDFQLVSGGANRKQFGFTSSALSDGTRVILDTIPGAPADQAGLLRGDRLVGLNGDKYNHDALIKLRESGGDAKLAVKRGQRDLTIDVQAKETSSRNLPRLSYQGTAAVIRIPTFTTGGGVAQAVHDELAQAMARGVSGVIVDLRDNGGGNLYECDLAASAFLPKLERQVRGADGNHVMSAAGGKWYMDGFPVASVQNPQLYGGPLAVLVNERSASCSEFFATLVQRAGRGKIIGETTSGVGNTSTSTYRLPDGGALHLTGSNYAFPDGGGYPDRVVPDEAVRDDLERFALGDDEPMVQALQALGQPTQVLLPGK